METTGKIGSNRCKGSVSLDRCVCVAPMMDYTPQEVKAQFRSASVLKGGRVVFNIAGNKYRLIVAFDYERQTCFVKFIGTHAQYDRIDAETVHYERPSDSH